MSFALVVHGHFYQPPRENPWTDDIDREPSAAPFHDWNARIHAECYRANAFARIHGRGGRIESIVNNYARLSFNFGPTLARWIERNDPRTHARLRAADAEQSTRLGWGGGMAQAYAHPIVPLCSPVDRRTQLAWGLADFRRRFGRPADGLWLPETAANVATLAELIELGVRYTIVAPEQVAAVRGPGDEEWSSVDRDTVDTGRAYRWMHPDGSGRFLTVAVFDGPMSRGVAFGDVTRDAASFMGMARESAARSRVSEPPLVLCASDGELYGHHKKFADLNLAFTSFVEGPRTGIEPTNLGAYLADYPATWEMVLAEGPDGKGTSWSCPHGVGRWWRDCGCTMVPTDKGWNHRWRTPLRAAMDVLQAAAAHFYEDAAASLLVDPWGARDAYGEVVDAPVAARDALLAEFGAPALAVGGEAARERVRLLLEMQRATLLMYASCGWYFDDIAGLEASLVLRFAAHAADLMNAAGGVAPVDEMLDLLARAKSNLPGSQPSEGVGGQSSAQTGADVFRRGAADRVTPRRALAAVAMALGGGGPGVAPGGLTPGHEVEILSQVAARDGRRLELSGEAQVTDRRLGSTERLPFEARWEAGQTFRVFVAGQQIEVSELGRESRHRLLPLLFPRILVEAGGGDSGRKGAALVAARLALDLGSGVLGQGDFLEDTTLRRGYAQLLVIVLQSKERFSASYLEVALRLLDTAGAELAPGAPQRVLVEELVAERRTARAAELTATATAKTVAVAASGTPEEALDQLAVRLNFLVAGDGEDEGEETRGAPGESRPPPDHGDGHPVPVGSPAVALAE